MIPVVIAVWFMSALEKRLHKVVPEIIDLFVTPLVTVLVTGYLTLTVFGPVFSWIENGVLDAVQFLITLPFGIGAALAGAAYPFTVVAGVHHMYNALEAGLLSTNGLNTWMPIATAANVAQGGAALAIALKTRNKKLKSLALPSSLSAFLGITEPVIFGVNLRYTKAFAAAVIGGAAGGLVADITGIGASAYGITGLFGYLITTNYVLQYTLLLAVSVGVSFAVSWVLFKDEKEETAKVHTSEEPAKTSDFLPEKNTAYAPLSGRAIPMGEVKEETFAAELLIHVGIKTVNLNGQYYTAHVSEGDTVKTGDLLLTFDMEKIRLAGYDLTTPVIVTNTDDYQR